MIRRPPRSTRVRSSAASDVYKRQASYRRSRRLLWSTIISPVGLMRQEGIRIMASSRSLIAWPRRHLASSSGKTTTTTSHVEPRSRQRQFDGERSYHPSHLIPTDLVSYELSGSGRLVTKATQFAVAETNRTRQRDLLRSGWPQPQPQPRQTGSLHSARAVTQFRCNKVS